MVKGKFEVGENEKHIIAVNANPFLKYIRIEVDGKRVIDVPNFVPSREFHLDVGELEKHQVEIHIRAFSPVKLLVDGEEAQEI
jgi:hypothetical protein